MMVIIVTTYLQKDTIDIRINDKLDNLEALKLNYYFQLGRINI